MVNQNDSEKYAYLDQLSMERLEALIRADIESPGNTNDEVIFHILEVMKKREQEHPTGRLVDVDEAWAEFQEHYNTPEGEGLSLYPTTDEESHSAKDTYDAVPVESSQRRKLLRLRPALRTAGIAAAIVVTIFATLITVQASGIDVFGALGRWTDETFRFVFSSSEAAQTSTNVLLKLENASYSDSLQAALEKCGITEDLVPTWHPIGFEASTPETIDTGLSNIVYVAFLGEEDRFYSIDITHYQSATALEARTFEKDHTPMEQYTSGTKTFYIFLNIDTVTATWSDGLLVETISGNISIDELKAIIDSIGVS